MDDDLRARCADALYVVTTDDEVIGGAAALVFMAETVGLIGASARLLRFPPVLWVLGVGYGVMARNRPLFARFLFRSDEGPFARPR